MSGLEKYLVQLRKGNRVKQVIVSANKYQDVHKVVEERYPDFKAGRISSNKSEIDMFLMMKDMNRGLR